MLKDLLADKTVPQWEPDSLVSDTPYTEDRPNTAAPETVRISLRNPLPSDPAPAEEEAVQNALSIVEGFPDYLPDPDPLWTPEVARPNLTLMSIGELKRAIGQVDQNRKAASAFPAPYLLSAYRRLQVTALERIRDRVLDFVQRKIEPTKPAPKSNDVRYLYSLVAYRYYLANLSFPGTPITAAALIRAAEQEYLAEKMVLMEAQLLERNTLPVLFVDAGSAVVEQATLMLLDLARYAVSEEMQALVRIEKIIQADAMAAGMNQVAKETITPHTMDISEIARALSGIPL